MSVSFADDLQQKTNPDHEGPVEKVSVGNLSSVKNEVAAGLPSYQYEASIARGFSLSEFPNSNWDADEIENMQRRAAYRLANALNCQEEAVLDDLFWLLGFSVHVMPGNPNPADLYAEGTERHSVLMKKMTSSSGYYPKVPDEKRKELGDRAYQWLIKVANLWSNNGSVDLNSYVEENTEQEASLSSIQKKERVFTRLRSKLSAHSGAQFTGDVERKFSEILREGRSIANAIAGNCQAKKEIYNYKGLFGTNSKKSYPYFRGSGYGPLDVNPKELEAGDIFKEHAKSIKEVILDHSDEEGKKKFIKTWAYRSHADLACLAEQKKAAEFEEGRYLLGAQFALNPGDLERYYTQERVEDGGLDVLTKDLSAALGKAEAVSNDWLLSSAKFWGKELPEALSEQFKVSPKDSLAMKYHVQRVIDLTRHLRQHSEGREAYDENYNALEWIDQHHSTYAPIVKKLSALFDSVEALELPSTGTQCASRKKGIESPIIKEKPAVSNGAVFTDIQERAARMRSTITHVGKEVTNLVNRCPKKVQQVLDSLKAQGKVFCYERKGLLGALVAGAGHTGGGTYNNNWRRHGHARDLPKWKYISKTKKRPYTGATGDNTVVEGGMNEGVSEAMVHHANQCFPYNESNGSGIKNVVKARHFGEVRYGEVTGLARYGNQTTRFNDGNAGGYYNALNKRYDRSIYIEPHFNSNDDTKANAHVLAALKKNPNLSLSQISGYNPVTDQAQVYYKRGRSLDQKLANIMGRSLHSSMNEGGYVSKEPLVESSGYSTFNATLSGNNRMIAVLVECAAMDGTKGAPRIHRDMSHPDYQVRLAVEKAALGQGFEPVKIRYGRELNRTEAIIPKVALKCSEGILAALAQMPEYQKTEAECKQLNAVD